MRRWVFSVICAALMTCPWANAETLDQQNVFVSAQGSTASGLSLELGQTFTVGISGLLSRVEVYLARFTFTTDDLVFSMYSTLGGLPDSHLGSMQLPASVVSTTAPDFVDFDVSPFNITANVGDHLAFGITSTGSGLYILPYSDSVLYNGGEPVARTMSSPPSDWSFPGGIERDYGFRTYMITASSPNGDFNSDSLWNCADVNALIVEMVAGTHNPLFDLTGDSLVNQNDLTEWLVVGGANNTAQTGGNPFRRGDGNLDGVVDGSDFNIWNSNKFTVNPAWCSGDFNGDGSIDGSDFNSWNGNKFTTSDSESLSDLGSLPGLGSLVPEPSSFMILALGLIVAMQARREIRGPRL